MHGANGIVEHVSDHPADQHSEAFATLQVAQSEADSLRMDLAMSQTSEAALRATLHETEGQVCAGSVSLMYNNISTRAGVWYLAISSGRVCRSSSDDGAGISPEMLRKSLLLGTLCR